MVLKFLGEDISMKPQLNLKRKSWVTLSALTGAALAISLTGFQAQAGQWDKRTVLTINEPMQVEDTLLQPGQYVFALNDVAQGANRHIVQIFRADGIHLITQKIAMPNMRLQPTGGSRFLMYETPAGSAAALRAWFYPGDNFGQEFTYPKHLEQIAVAQTHNETVAQAEPPAEPAPVAQPEATVETQQQTEVAQNEPPAPPAAIQEQPSVSSPPAVLPQTASPYPLIGLMGLLLLGLGGFIRQTRSV
jgi:LPXTG-motif cell wall-anchored protein